MAKSEVPDRRRELGRLGESLALEFYRGRSAEILGRNVRCAMGEIDLVVREAGTIVFVEVKSAARAGRLPPEVRVGPAKQRKLTQLAEWYLQTSAPPGSPARFDVLAVTIHPDSGEAQIEHFADAFPACG